MKLNKQQVALVRHALGLDNSKKSYRNRYIGRNGDWDWLVEEGLAGCVAMDDLCERPLYWAKLELAQMVLKDDESLDKEDFPDAIYNAPPASERGE